MLLIGSHISLNKSGRYLIGVVEESANNGANTFMIFTGAPHNKNRVPISSMNLEEAIELGKQRGILFSNAVIHAPYLINLANPVEENESFNIDFLISEIRRTQMMGIKYIVLHPGYHVNQSEEDGLNRLIKNLNCVLSQIQDSDVIVCLETMSNKKNQLGGKLEHIFKILSGCNNHKNLGICLDTVHLHDAGYDVINRKEIFKQIEDTVGWDRVKVLHVGDAEFDRGSTKDRHANFGYGKIGFDVLLEWIYDPVFSHMPIIVETPFWLYGSDLDNPKLQSPYKHEIEMIKNKHWKPIPDGYFPRNYKKI